MKKSIFVLVQSKFSLIFFFGGHLSTRLFYWWAFVLLSYILRSEITHTTMSEKSRLKTLIGPKTNHIYTNHVLIFFPSKIRLTAKWYMSLLTCCSLSICSVNSFSTCFGSFLLPAAYKQSWQSNGLALDLISFKLQRTEHSFMWMTFITVYLPVNQCGQHILHKVCHWTRNQPGKMNLIWWQKQSLWHRNRSFLSEIQIGF